jgi:hypothetical protein
MDSSHKAGVTKSRTAPTKGASSNVSKSVSDVDTYSQRSVVSRSFVDSIESAAIKQILHSFPTSEEMARSMNTTGWTDSLFVANTQGDNTYVTVPKNIEDFRDSLMMSSILRCYAYKNWIPTLSTAELPKAVLDTKEGAFFAGFVMAASYEKTGPLQDANTKYSRGIRAFQIFSVEKTMAKSRHLRNGGMAALTERLSGMKGFTQAFWGLRASLVTLFKSLRPIPVSDLSSYVKSKEELLKIVKTRLHFENGGCYRPEELRFLSERYVATKTKLNAFLMRIERPDEELAAHFDEIYAPIKSELEIADNEIKANLAARARILFPNDNKKRSQTWARKSLSEKLSELSEDKLKEFLPETLPGISANPVPIEGNPDQRTRALQRRYSRSESESAREVITSWYANYDSSLEEA